MNAGIEQKPTLTISGDELRLSDANSGVVGGPAEAVFRRAR
jgi:hypothetical protein